MPSVNKLVGEFLVKLLEVILAVVLAIAMSPVLGGFEAEFIKTNTITPQCAGQCNQLEIRVKTKASPVQELLKVLLNIQ